jgi:radical SAM superfamily enzyme YgiQ (UPF0313 family)
MSDKDKNARKRLVHGEPPMRIYFINPSNPLVSIVDVKESRWNRYRVWKPLSLLVLAGLTPSEWDISIVDENLGIPDYKTMPRPDVVGITAFTSQATRAYELAAYFRNLGVPVIMGGIHASMRQEEAIQHVDTIVTGEAESVWPQVLEDAKNGTLKQRYAGGLAEVANVPLPRHDMLDGPYAFGAIQTSRGCPLNCSFCSVTAFNGTAYRQRAAEDVVREFQAIKEKRVLVVDDNLTGTRTEHIARAKELFRAMADANLKKQWVSQVTINFADDEELLKLAVKAGCSGVFIGFEATDAEGLAEVGKKFNIKKNRDLRESVRRIQRHGMIVTGSFIIGLDVDKPGIGKHIANKAREYCLDHLNVLFMTPLPGTRLWQEMEADNRITLNQFPQDWQYYTLTYPVAPYKNLSLEKAIQEMTECGRSFYAAPRILGRVSSNILQRRHPLISLVGSLSYRSNMDVDSKKYEDFRRTRGHVHD